MKKLACIALLVGIACCPVVNASDTPPAVTHCSSNEDFVKFPLASGVDSYIMVLPSTKGWGSGSWSAAGMGLGHEGEQTVPASSLLTVTYSYDTKTLDCNYYVVSEAYNISKTQDTVSLKGSWLDRNETCNHSTGPCTPFHTASCQTTADKPDACSF